MSKDISADAYNPSLNPTKEDTNVYMDLIAMIEQQYDADPTCPKMSKILKLLRVHSAWFPKF